MIKDLLGNEMAIGDRVIFESGRGGKITKIREPLNSHSEIEIDESFTADSRQALKLFELPPGTALFSEDVEDSNESDESHKEDGQTDSDRTEERSESFEDLS